MLKQVGLIDTLQSIRHQHLVDTLHALHKYGHVPNPISRHASSRREDAAAAAACVGLDDLLRRGARRRLTALPVEPCRVSAPARATPVCTLAVRRSAARSARQRSCRTCASPPVARRVGVFVPNEGGAASSMRQTATTRPRKQTRSGRRKLRRSLQICVRTSGEPGSGCRRT